MEQRPGSGFQTEGDDPDADYWASSDLHAAKVWWAQVLQKERRARKDCPECGGVPRTEFDDVRVPVRQCETCRAKTRGRPSTSTDPVYYRASRSAFPHDDQYLAAREKTRTLLDACMRTAGSAIQDMSHADQGLCFLALRQMGVPARIIAEEAGCSEATVSRRVVLACKHELCYSAAVRIVRMKSKQLLPLRPGSSFANAAWEAPCEWCGSPGALGASSSRPSPGRTP
jgi:hypothetical protein